MPAISRTAAASEPGAKDVELRYTRRAGAQICPDDPVLREAVQQHLGYDPFTTAGAAKRIITVTIAKTARGLRAQIESLDSRGAVAGSRSLDSPSTDCKELVSSVALAVSIAIDPVRSMGPAPAPAPTSAPPVSAPPVDKPANDQDAAIAPSSPAPPLTTIVSAAFVMGLGNAPALSLGGAVEARLRKDLVSLGLGVRADAPASASASFAASTASENESRVQSSLFVATVVPCVHAGAFAVCASSQFGALSGTASHVVTSEHHSTFFSAVGARGAFGLPLGDLFAVGVYAEALATLTPTKLEIDGKTAWSTSAVAGDLGLQAAVHFP